MMVKTGTGVALAVLLSCLAATIALADERILNYHSDITVMEDGSMTVVETITVRAEGQRIRRGIYRDFPTDYKDRLGNRVRVGFDVLEVRRDRAIEPFHTEKRANGVRVYVGSADVFLAPGEYEYAISYRVTQMLGFFEDHDELYWNVTGNGWDFLIESASASITLPAGIESGDIKIEGYTGGFSDQDKAYTAIVNFQGIAEIQTTGRLAARQGLTVVVSWPKGYVKEPTRSEKMALLLRQNLGLLLVLSASLASLVYLFFAWTRVGRDPPPGVIFPHYEAPEGYSPASIRYIWKMGYDKRALTAAVLNLAVKGFFTIESRDDAYTLRSTGKTADHSLAPGEAVLLSKLFEKNDSVQLEDENHAVIRKAMDAHASTLKRYHQQRYFSRNGLFLLPSFFILIGALLVTVIIGQISPAIIIAGVLSGIVVALFAWLLRAPTLLGRKLLDKVEGFRLYLEKAEKDDLDLRNPPEKTPELFETLLPFALALGVEQPWAEQFEDVFRKIPDREQAAYAPAWYSGRWDAGNPAKMANVVGASLSSAISSASTPPGSSSGSGGGGFSGGGGGGGGGGGW
ncbi:MAG: DUF2207 domain-containing protein [Gammaproteobacteria bacterium]|nr:DUF2207 domain-containing protein [Gammaproteobacteria bacterium]